jgi:hypothetical protein
MPRYRAKLLEKALKSSTPIQIAYLMKILERASNTDSSHGNHVPRWCENNPFQVVQLPIGVHDAN